MEYNVVLYGESGVGKSSFISRHLTGKFSNDVENCSMHLYTTEGKIKLNLYEKDYPETVDAVMLMFDLTRAGTFNRLTSQYDLVSNKWPNAKIVLCGNKCDLKDRKVSHKMISKLIHVSHKTLGLIYFDISAKSLYNYEKPFLYLLRQISQKDSLSFRELTDPGLITAY